MEAMDKEIQVTDSSVLVPEIPYLRRYARALTRNAASADDIVQDAMVRALANMHRFEGGTNLRAWLLTIVHNCFIDGTRKAKRTRENDANAEQALSGMYTRPSQIANLEMGDLGRALDTLPEDQRITLVLVALEDLSYDEAAAVTGVPIGTVRSRLSRARHALMSKVEGLTMNDVSPEPGITRRRKPGALPANHIRALRQRPVGVHQNA
jgi:RNA polymerase sigma-70 factor (ECF subfamily)